MSRYKRLGGMDFDKKRNSDKASADQLELLAAWENVSVDDLLDEGLSQGQVMFRLANVIHADIIPEEVIERRRQRKEEAARARECRICTTLDTNCEGSITLHHFVPRWLMLKLDNYEAYAPRSGCTIPICMGRHRDLHLGGDMETPKSIAQFMTEDERKFAQKMLDELFEEHPFTKEWLDGGDPKWAYEAQLIEDYNKGLFRKLNSVSAEAIDHVSPLAVDA